jgi:hypothetical protein
MIYRVHTNFSSFQSLFSEIKREKDGMDGREVKVKELARKTCVSILLFKQLLF